MNAPIVKSCLSNDLHVVQRQVSDLKPYPRNARTHSKKQIHQIARSIEEFGFVSPVIINGEDQILSGHGPVDAAKLLKLDEVPTIPFPGFPENGNIVEDPWRLSSK
jgi:hypothetical protein